MRNYRYMHSVEPIQGKFCVIRREQWEAKGSDGVYKLMENKVVADGPFHTREEAEEVWRRISAPLP